MTTLIVLWCLGDSILNLVCQDLMQSPRLPEEIRVVNVARPGETAAEALDRLPADPTADWILLHYGTNDMVQGEDPQRTFEHLTAIERRLAPRKVIWTTLPIGRDWNRFRESEVLDDYLERSLALNELIRKHHEPVSFRTPVQHYVDAVHPSRRYIATHLMPRVLRRLRRELGPEAQAAGPVAREGPPHVAPR